MGFDPNHSKVCLFRLDHTTLGFESTKNRIIKPSEHRMVPLRLYNIYTHCQADEI